MEPEVLKILDEVIRVAPALHNAGTFSAATFRAIARHASARPIRHSVETGAGASTLLFSHLSPDHVVFAMDLGNNSVRAVQSSSLLRREAVTLVEGPTQVTLPQHRFTNQLQLVLIDGPHAYPFPDLEYYYLYPHLERDALLIVDDIHIPTITNMFDFIRADAMFDLQEVVETTAFFRRTDAPTFSPVNDRWSTQQYNKRAFEAVAAESIQGLSPERSEQPTPCYVDQIGPFIDPMKFQVLRVPRGERLPIAGWAIDAARGRPAGAVDLVLDELQYRAAVRIPRPDVAAALGDRAYILCGFSTWLPPLAITPGLHTLEMRVVLDGGRAYYSGARLQFDAVEN